MAVFKQELNWSTYQNNQLKILESIDMSLRSSLQIDKSSYNVLSKSEIYLEAIAKATLVSTENISDLTKDLLGSARVFSESVRSVSHSAEGFGVSLDSAGDTTRGFKEDLERSQTSLQEFDDSLKNSSSKLSEVAKNLVSQIEYLLPQVARKVDEFSDTSNQMIRISGMNGESVREFRSEIVRTIGDLNEVTGYAFSPMESYNQIVSISQGVTSNLEAIEEMARPLLLTQETLDVNINSVADLFNKFYTRYNFSSMHMEALMDDIRGNTAGNSANAEATLENIKSLESWINLIAKHDNEERFRMIEEISPYTSWLERNNMDSTYYTKAIEAIAYGDWGENKELLNILSRVDISATEAQDMVRGGQWEEITVAITKGMRLMLSDVQDSRALGRSFDNLGIPRDTAMDNITALDSEGFIGFKEFLESLPTNGDSMVDLVEDKYVSAADKANHWLEQIYSKVADIQEQNPLGFGMSDVLMGAAVAKGILGDSMWKSIGTSISTIFGRGATTLGGGGGVTGMLPTAQTSAFAASNPLLNRIGHLANPATAGTAATGAAALGGIAAGGLAVWDGLRGAIDEDKSAASRVASGVEAAAGGLGAAFIAASITNPVGWVALAVAGISFIAKKAIDDATALSGNAKLVEEELKSVEEGLQAENKRRLDSISELTYLFNQESDVEEQRRLMRESGLFSEEELNKTADDQLKSLIDSYRNAISAMDDVTEGALKLANKYYGEQQDEQQKDFINSLKEMDLSGDQRKDIITMLQDSVTDDKLLKKFEKYLKDGEISKSEFNDLLYGGKNKIFDEINMTDKTVDISGMRNVYGYLDMDTELVTDDNKEEVFSLYNAFKTALNDEERERAYQDIINSGLEDEVRKVYKDQLEVYGYDTGTNYVPNDQLAILHEGEAVVPKQYNPAVNNDYSDSVEYLKSFVSELREIREFLADWKESREKLETISRIQSRHASGIEMVSKYLPIRG